jgi:ERF superfamily
MQPNEQAPVETEWREIPATYRTSKTVGKLYAAIAKAQMKLKAAIKDAKNPDKGNRYATLASVIDATMPYTEAGIAILQIPTCGGSTVSITTLIGFEDEWLESTLDLQAMVMRKGGVFETMMDPQSIASAITYARRYALTSILLIAQDDDDGEKVQKTVQQQKAEAKAEQDRVRDERIAAEKAKAEQQQKAEPLTFEQKMMKEFDAADQYERLKLFDQLKKVVMPAVFGMDQGEPKYYEILQGHEVEHANKFKTPALQRACFRDLLLIALKERTRQDKEKQAAHTISKEPFVASDEDVPENIGAAV